ncbi:MAG TPA: hypothetical protein VF921_15745 [Vicinamibacterales bacterium]
MKRVVLTSAALLCALALAPAAFAQAKAAPKKAAATKDAVPAAPTPPSPELLRARMRPPVKGTAYVEVIKGSAKKVGNEIQNTHKVRNISSAPIVGLRIDEFFYAGQKEIATGSGRMRTALAPGEIAEISTAALWQPGITNSQLQFSQANGGVKPTAVKKFTEDKK